VKSCRPELAEAMAVCRLHGATLVIAKLDRLSRNAAFLLTLRDAGVEFMCCDMPDANRLTVGILAMVAEDEAERISARTKAALAAAKARGTRLGGFRGYIPGEADRAAAVAALGARARQTAAAVLPAIRELQAAGIVSLNGIARELTRRGIPTPRVPTAASIRFRCGTCSACSIGQGDRLVFVHSEGQRYGGAWPWKTSTSSSPASPSGLRTMPGVLTPSFSRPPWSSSGR
jgi:DNA invertase Pin-like site-specific DNA recombinase